MPFLFHVLLGCPEVCDGDALRARFATPPDPTAAAAALGASCEVPDALRTWLAEPSSTPSAEVEPLWDLACPSGPDLAGLTTGPRLETRRRAHRECALTTASEDAFARAVGHPLLAVTLEAWLRSVEVDADLAHAAALAVLGAPVVDGALPALPALSDGTPLAGPTAVVVVAPGTDASALAGGATGPAVLAVDGGTPLDTVHAVAVALAGDQALLGADADWFRTVALQVTTAAPNVRVVGDSALVDGVVVPRSDLAAALAKPREGGWVVHFADPATLADWLALAAPGAALAGGPEPCVPGASGMACVAGGSARVAGAPAEVPTFWIDADEVTVADWRGCQKAGACKAAVAGADAAAATVAWDEADRYCTWAGKRLPTEAEWTRAAAAPGGAKDLDAEPAEWTDTWFAASACPSCGGFAPRGPCDGATPCKGHDKMVVRAGATRTALSRAGRAGVRCAASDPWLTRFPPRPVTDVPPDPSALTAEEQALVRGIREDAIWEKPKCQGEWGTVTLSCRDPLTYVKSNEQRSWVAGPYLKNRGGAYIGVGADQNYTFVAMARSQIVFLLDYDPDVVALHMVNRALILASDTPVAFAERFAGKGQEESLRILGEAYKDHPEKDYFLAHYRQFRPQLESHYSYRSAPSSTYRPPGGDWLQSQEMYAYVKKLWETGRMWPVKGDLTAQGGAMVSIAENLGELGVPLRVLYVSNAPSAWSGALVPGYRANVAGLPTDERSVLFESFGGYGVWRYTLQRLQLHQELITLPGYSEVSQLLARRVATDQPDLTLSGLPSD